MGYLIILDEPYVSQILKDTIVKMNMPVLKNKTSERLGFNKDVKLLEDAEFIELLKSQKTCKIYSNSEISLVWIENNLGFTGILEKIGIFKDKLRSRQLIEHIYPDFSYQGVKFESLDELDIGAVRKPFIIKQAVGFFSAGVYKVSTGDEWAKVLSALKREMAVIKGLFPAQVFSSGKFVLEDCIEGPELAVDAYYNGEGKPVVLNILKHLFPAENDVEDQVYVTSKKTIEIYLEAVLKLLRQINEAAKLRDCEMRDYEVLDCEMWDSEFPDSEFPDSELPDAELLGPGLRDFPLHIELRVDKNNRLVLI